MLNSKINNKIKINSHKTTTFKKNYLMTKRINTTAALFGLLAIVFGAFGAHALKNLLTAEQLLTFETGVKYQMYHALFLLFLGVNSVLSDATKKVIYTLIFIGVVLFSGSIYLLATNDLTLINIKSIGFLTPIGGLFLIAGWGLFFIKSIKNKS